MNRLSEKHQTRLEESLARLNELFSRAKPEDDGVQLRKSRGQERREELLKSTGGQTKLCVICMTPRSGSTFFSEALKKTKSLGNPGEWFNPHDGKNIEQMVDRYGAQSREEVLDGIYNFSATDNGVAVVKGDFFQCLPFMYDGLINRHFDYVRWVYLTREDTLAQAVSRYIGTVTGSWSSAQKAEQSEVPYDPELIEKQVDFLIDMESGWKRFFATRHIRPLPMSYEQLTKSLPKKIEQICKFMSIEPVHKITDADLSLKKQGTDRNIEMVQRFAAEYKKTFNQELEATSV